MIKSFEITTLDGEKVILRAEPVGKFQSTYVRGGRMKKSDVLSWTWAAAGPEQIFLGGLFRTGCYRFRCSTPEVYRALRAIESAKADEILNAYRHNNYESYLQ